jgi:hypothetical protein
LDLGHEWEQALHHQYDKNDAVHFVAQPTPIEDVPKELKSSASIHVYKSEERARFVSASY